MGKFFIINEQNLKLSIELFEAQVSVFFFQVFNEDANIDDASNLSFDLNAFEQGLAGVHDRGVFEITSEDGQFGFYKKEGRVSFFIKDNKSSYSSEFFSESIKSMTDLVELISNHLKTC